MTLRVTLEIVPFGDEDKKYTIEEINISNVGKHHSDICEYVVEDNDYKNLNEDTLRIQHHRSDGALTLAAMALDEVNDKRNSRDE